MKGWSYGLYDTQDEEEAFNRGRMFGSGATFKRNKDAYKELPNSADFSETIRKDGYGEHKYTIDKQPLRSNVITSAYIAKQERLLKDPLVSIGEKEETIKELHRLAKDYKTVFRVNGVTYSPK